MEVIATDNNGDFLLYQDGWNVRISMNYSDPETYNEIHGGYGALIPGYVQEDRLYYGKGYWRMAREVPGEPGDYILNIRIQCGRLSGGCANSSLPNGEFTRPFSVVCTQESCNTTTPDNLTLQSVRVEPDEDVFFPNEAFSIFLTVENKASEPVNNVMIIGSAKGEYGYWTQMAGVSFRAGETKEVRLPYHANKLHAEQKEPYVFSFSVANRGFGSKDIPFDGTASVIIRPHTSSDRPLFTNIAPRSPLSDKPLVWGHARAMTYGCEPGDEPGVDCPPMVFLDEPEEEGFSQSQSNDIFESGVPESDEDGPMIRRIWAERYPECDGIVEPGETCETFTILADVRTNRGYMLTGAEDITVTLYEWDADHEIFIFPTELNQQRYHGNPYVKYFGSRETFLGEPLPMTVCYLVEAESNGKKTYKEMDVTFDPEDKTLINLRDRLCTRVMNRFSEDEKMLRRVDLRIERRFGFQCSDVNQ